MDLDQALELKKGAFLKANTGWIESSTAIRITQGRHYELLMEVMYLVRDGNIVNAHFAIEDDWKNIRYPSYQYFEIVPFNVKLENQQLEQKP